jgi:Zinc carboxypeptidase
VRTTLLTGFILGLGFTQAALAQQSRPNGPWLEGVQHMSLERLHTYEELTLAVHRIAARSGGRIQLESIGKTNLGRDIWLASVGTGATGVMYVTQQHGNEPLGTEAALQLLNRIATGNGPAVQKLLDKLTLTVVVRANPDGSELFQRQNVDPNCSGAFCLSGVGFDINRYHNPSLAPENNPVPEAAALQRAYARYQPHVVVDFHHQGSYVSAEGDLITTSTFWPNVPEVHPGVVSASKQVAWLIADTLGHYGFSEVSQYPGLANPGIARNAYGLLGSASVLLEFRGDIGQKSSGYLIRSAYAAMAAVLEAAAEGTLGSINPALADTIPPRGAFITDPTPH